MAEAGLPLETPIQTAVGPAAIEDVLREMLLRFEISQEIEWTTVAAACYFPSARGWANRFGTVFTFDRLAQALLERRPGDGACYGIHKLYALVTLLRVHDKQPLLSPATAGQIRRRLHRCAYDLERFQHPDGSWSSLWNSAGGPAPDAAIDRDPVTERIRATGHHLEWIALAPVDLRPSVDCIRKAARFLAAIITTQKPRYLVNEFSTCSHAARALALLTGSEPSTLLTAYQEDREEPGPSKSAPVSDCDGKFVRPKSMYHVSKAP